MSVESYSSNGPIYVDEEVLEIAYDNKRVFETFPSQEMEDDPIDFKSDYVSHLVSTDGPNYDNEEGYHNLETVDRLLNEGLELDGSDNDIRDRVIEQRDELREQGKKDHADQLDTVLIGKRSSGKLSCREVKGGQGIHPGDPNNIQNHKHGGPANNVRDRDYSQFEDFSINRPDLVDLLE